MYLVYLGGTSKARYKNGSALIKLFMNIFGFGIIDGWSRLKKE